MPSLQTIIILLIFVGPLILRAIAKYAEWQKNSIKRNRDRARNRDEMDGRISFDTDEVTNQVQQQDPASMTMAQRIEMARQRAQQQADPRRAEIEAQRRAQQEAQRRAQAEVLRRQQAAAHDQARHRQVEEQARRQRQSPQRSQTQPSRPTQRTVQGQIPTARPVSRKQQRSSGQRRRVQATIVPGEQAVTSRRVTAPMKRLSRARGGASLPPILSGVSLKQAFVLKELLDRPIALRKGSSEYPA